MSQEEESNNKINVKGQKKNLILDRKKERKKK